MSDGAADRSRVLELVLKHMYAKVGICEERVLVGSNPPTRITHVFHARLKGPMIPCRARPSPEGGGINAADDKLSVSSSLSSFVIVACSIMNVIWVAFVRAFFNTTDLGEADQSRAKRSNAVCASVLR